jgi:hypothetical protein
MADEATKSPRIRPDLLYGGIRKRKSIANNLMMHLISPRKRHLMQRRPAGVSLRPLQALLWIAN